MQVLLNLKKKYKGQIRTERLAARIYDKRAICAHGIKAKTNFSYTKKQLERILASREDLIEQDLLPSELEETLDNWASTFSSPSYPYYKFHWATAVAGFTNPTLFL